MDDGAASRLSGLPCVGCLLNLLQDVASDPTLPRTREVTCPACQHNEAVFFSASSEQVSA